ncbi:uncharacterized protein LOC141762193 [Sebastes fasciatus]|uniref:uncharacterized protein LOC141762193 n=1 Tax=Sebastes fasciatus TaxID=394691 RepID=UPI003D9F2D03
MTAYIDFDSQEFEMRDFFLTTLEQTCRVQLNDSEAKISRSTSEGRILLEVQQDELGNFFDCLPEQQDNNWGQEKGLLQREISGLKAQLAKAQAKRGHSPSRDKSLKSEMEKMKGENEALRKELEDMKSERKMLAVAKTNMEWEMEGLLEIEKAQTKELQGELSKTKMDLQKTKDEAKTHQAQLNEQRAETEKVKKHYFQTENAAIQEATEKYVTNCLSELEELRVNRSEMMAALKEAEEELKSGYHMWQEKKSSHLAELETSQRSHLAQLKMQDEEHKTIVADLKSKLEDQLASERLLWQQEKTSLLEETVKTNFSFAAQLHEQKQSNDTLVAALETAEQQIESHRIERQESSLLQAKSTESVQQTLQEKEQEWTTTESSLRSQLADLENQIAKRKRTKWYRKLI